MQRPCILLRRNGVLAIKRGIRIITCSSGTLWITATGTGDIMLRAGESLDVGRCRDLCVQALADSELRMEPDHRPTQRKGTRLGLAAL